MPQNSFRRNLSPHRFVVIRRRMNHMTTRKADVWREEVVSRHKSIHAARKAARYQGTGGYQGLIIRRLTEGERYQR
jgi:hypothetical protein